MEFQGTSHLLSTKFHVQSIRDCNVSRHELIGRLKAGIDRKLTIISAPAGYGKSSLAGEWVAEMAATESAGVGTSPRIAWLSLDPEDDVLDRFVMYLVGALVHAIGRTDSSEQFGQATMELLGSPLPPAVEQTLTPLLNQISSLGHKVVLVLDDLHFIDNGGIHKAVAFLVRRAPPNLHVCILTRLDPPVGLAELRAKGQLTEIRAADLRFSLSEAAEFMERGFDVKPSANEVQALVDRTEGWPAGLQLAGISLQGKPNVSELIAAFSGSNVHVAEYLIDEVIARQAEEVQRFLLMTSIVSRLSGPLCNAITGTADGSEILGNLAASNLFLVPLDNHRGWYRYHHLFSDLLAERLRSRSRAASRIDESAEELHQRASEWYEANGYLSDAVEGAYRAGNLEHAADLVDRCADDVWGQSHHGDLQRWLRKLPENLIVSNPRLCVYRAWYLVFEECVDEADRLLAIADEAVEDRASPLRGRIEAIRGLAASFRNDQPGQIRHASAALELLPRTDTTFGVLPPMTLGDLYLHRGDVERAVDAYHQAAQISGTTGSSFMSLISEFATAMPLRYTGRLSEVERIVETRLSTAESAGLSELPEMGWGWAILGEVLAETNDLERAVDYTRRGIALARGDVRTSTWAYHCAPRVLFSAGRIEEAGEVSSAGAKMAAQAAVPWVPRLMAAWKARVAVALGDPNSATVWLEGISTRLATASLGEDFFELIEFILGARVLIILQRYPEADSLLSRLLPASERGGNVSASIEVRCLQALCMVETGREEEALLPLEGALSMGGPLGFFQTYLDQGDRFAGLLYRAASRGVQQGFINRLLAALPPEPTGDIRREQATSANTRLFEPLSDRELDVLHLVSEGLRYDEIGEKLFISVHTVKVHARNINGKLETHSRSEAVARARRLGLLPTP